MKVVAVAAAVAALGAAPLRKATAAATATHPTFEAAAPGVVKGALARLHHQRRAEVTPVNRRVESGNAAHHVDESSARAGLENPVDELVHDWEVVDSSANCDYRLEVRR